VVIIGGGWSGCAATLTARKAGAEVELLERTDMLLGSGLVGGIFRNNGRFTAAEEMIALGGGELFNIMDALARHVNIEFPGHKHSSLYDAARIEPEVHRLLKKIGVKTKLQTRIIELKKEKDTIISVSSDEGETYSGDVFIDCTGTAANTGNCVKYGNGCAMCVYRCPTFKTRVSISEKAGAKDKIAMRSDGTPGVFSGSCKIMKHTLSSNIVKELDEKGVSVIPIPKNLVDESKLSKKACAQYALPEYAQNIVLLDTGFAKMMTPFFPLELLRQIPGFENARYEDPYSGGIGNSIRYMAIAPRDNALRVSDITNLYCAGEKSGLTLGHTEVIVTGSLAGYNS
jgi:tRNA U34 5-carboxymethylaminomethyl modifying enzyme MnmG/GidA